VLGLESTLPVYGQRREFGLTFDFQNNSLYQVPNDLPVVSREPRRLIPKPRDACCQLFHRQYVRLRQRVGLIL